MFAGFILAVSFSIDALVVGFSYTLQQIRISPAARLLIGLITILIFEGTVFVGNLCRNVLPADVLEVIGMLMLLIIGLEFVRTALKRDNTKTFDWNHSKDINFKEAICLALSLSMDSAAAGIAAVIVGMQLTWLGVLTGIMQMLFLGLGIHIARHALCIRLLNERVCGIFSGVLLIVIACVRFCF